MALSAAKNIGRDEKIKLIEKALSVDQGLNRARAELASLYEDQRDFLRAYMHYNDIKKYSKAIECLEKLGNYEMLGTYYAKRGRADQALHYLYLAQEEIAEKYNYDNTNSHVIAIQERIQNLVKNPEAEFENQEFITTRKIDI